MPRVLVLATTISTRFGGEAILPFQYFQRLRRRGVEAWLVTHARSRDELVGLLPEEAGRMFFVEDTRVHKLLARISEILPRRIAYLTTGFLLSYLTMRSVRAIARRLIQRERIEVVHQPTPVSPREPSLVYGLGAPVVMGPFNGGMTFPPAFVHHEGWSSHVAYGLGRQLANLMNALMPGKRRAATICVANERTRRALPKGLRGRVVELVENGVDLALWKPPEHMSTPRVEGDPTRFLYMGRLVEWKAVDLLLEAFRNVLEHHPATMTIAGEGAIRPALEAQAERLGIASSVRFLGWIPQEQCPRIYASADVLVLPSLYECGGAVVLEAMLMGMPVVATRWGGPADYLDDTCGILVEPKSREALITGFTDAMLRLVRAPELRRQLGENGRQLVQSYDWERKVDAMLAIYDDAIARYAARDSRAPA